MLRETELIVAIEGMHCAGCVRNVERQVGRLTGVSECTVNLAMKTAVVNFDSGAVDGTRIIESISELGYEVTVGSPDILTLNRKEEKSAKNRLRLSLGFAIPLMTLAMWPMIGDEHLFPIRWDGVVQAVLAAIILFYLGGGILVDAGRQARHFRANMSSLIAVGTLTAFGWSLYVLVSSFDAPRFEQFYFDSAGMIVTLILVGRYLEAKAKGRAGNAIEALLNLRPAKTTAIIDGVEVEIESTTVQPGMTLFIKPGERLPADGRIIDGDPVIDESMLTGESLPVEKKVGDEVLGGSLNVTSSFKFDVSAAGEGSFLANVIKLVTQAQNRKAPVQRLADRVAGVLAPTVIVIALVTLAVWLSLDPGSPLLIRSVISVLIIACPCALGLATPTAILAGTGRAARDGVIIRGGDTLEALTGLNTVVFDKTGTLTRGELDVVHTEVFGDMSDHDLIQLAASAESHSEHPLAAAIVRHAREKEITLVLVSDVQARPGFGLQGEFGGRQLLLGNRFLMKSRKVAFGESTAVAEREMNKGRTVVFLALDGEVFGVISLADRLRNDAREVVAQLKATMSQVTVLSGDSYRTVANVAGSLGLDHFEAEIKPDGKKIAIETYRKAGYRVAMIGDGINDAPALAMADVGVAIGSGTDIAKETADVILVRSELTAVLKMFAVARFTMKIIKQNLFWAFFYNLVAIPLAAGLFYPAFGWTLSPTIAAAAMAFSSVTVVTNSLRLNRFQSS